VVLFSLPFAALLAGVAVAPLLEPGAWSRGRRFAATAAAATVLAVLACWLTFVRGGNDPYVSFSRADRAAVLEVYRLLEPGQSLGFFAAYVPAGDRGLGTYDIVLPDDSEEAPRDQSVEQLLTARPDYLLFTEGQRRWGELVRGWPPAWQDQVVQRFLADGYEQVPAPAPVTLLHAPRSGLIATPAQPGPASPPPPGPAPPPSAIPVRTP
jgi:hypothetical protein